MEEDGPDGEPIYYFGKIAFAIRNVPVLPYVKLSENIQVRVEKWDKGPLAYGYFNYTPIAEMSLKIGSFFDRNYYPDHNLGNATLGDKINVMKVWFQSNSKFGVDSYAHVHIPKEVLINLNIKEENQDVWIKNETEIDCDRI